jgi:hypothetical protein
VDWSPKDPDEILPLGIDLEPLLASGETLLVVASAMRVERGTDATPSAMLLGSPTIVGTTVQQWVQGGVLGVSYRLAFTADTSLGKRIVESGGLRVDERG